MHILKTVFSLLLILLLVLVPFTACGSPAGDDGVTTDGRGDGGTEKGPEDETTAPETELTIVIVPTPSLSSEGDVKEIGIRAGDTIISCTGSFGGGSIYDGTNASGRPLWKSASAEVWPIDPGVNIPEGFPTIVVQPGTELTVVNNGGYEVSLTTYMNYESGLDVGATAPTLPGTYLFRITATNKRPGASDPLPELGAKFGDWNFFAVVSVEE